MPLKFGEKNIVISFIVAILFVTVIIFVGIGAALYFGLDNLIALFPLIQYSVMQGLGITIVVSALSFFVLRIIYRLHSKILADTLGIIVIYQHLSREIGMKQ